MNKDSRIYVAGHTGLVGSAIVRELNRQGYRNVLTLRMDLRDRFQAHWLMESLHPDVVFLAAAKVGGIQANSELPVDFLMDNLRIQNNVIEAAARQRVKKLVFLGSSCIYPRDCPQPIKEKYLMTGPLEETNQWYATAKIAGIKLCQAYRKQYGLDFISVMPTNLYGPGDNYHPEHSHVIPGLIRRFHEAKARRRKQVTCWGTGQPMREFLHSDDLARACIRLVDGYSSGCPINAGSGEEISILTLAYMIKKVVGFEGDVLWDFTKPDGTVRKVLDSSKIFGLGWKPEVTLAEGLSRTYLDFQRTL